MYNNLSSMSMLFAELYKYDHNLLKRFEFPTNCVCTQFENADDSKNNRYFNICEIIRDFCEKNHIEIFLESIYVTRRNYYSCVDVFITIYTEHDFLEFGGLYCPCCGELSDGRNKDGDEICTCLQYRNYYFNERINKKTFSKFEQ